MSLESTFSELNDFYVVVEQNGKSFVVFTKVTSAKCTLSITDSKTFWEKEINNEEIETQENYLTKLKHNLLLGDVTLCLETGSSTLAMTIGKVPTALKIDAVVSSDMNSQDKLADLLFAMARHSTNKEKELEKLTKEVTTLQCLQSNNRGAAGAEENLARLSNEFNPRPRGTTQAKVRRQPGMSVINPSSKKVKTGQGIEFK